MYAKNDNDPDIYASGIVSAYQILTIINLISFGFILAGLKRPDLKLLIPLILIIFTINFFRYERGFDISKLDDRWGNEPKKRRKIRWIFMIAYLVVIFLIPWIYGFYHN